MFDGVVSELDAAGAVAVAAELRATADVAEARLLEVAAHFADLHPEPFRSAGSTYLPGMERAVVYGGEGCPAVAEFAPVELGAALGITSPAAAYLIGGALALRHRLSRVWARVLAGEVQAWRARRIASACWRLSQTAAALVDARVAAIANSVTVHRLDQVVAAAVIDADLDQAAADADRARSERGVWVGQSDLHGTKTMVVKAATGEWSVLTRPSIRSPTGSLNWATPTAKTCAARKRSASLPTRKPPLTCSTRLPRTPAATPTQPPLTAPSASPTPR